MQLGLITSEKMLCVSINVIWQVAPTMYFFIG